MDVSRERILLLTKMKGPAFLLGKDNFPGGRLEPNEKTEAAAIREVMEETNVRIEPHAIALLKTRHLHHDTLHTFVALVPQQELEKAQTMEAEPVRVERIDSILAHWALHPETVASDVPALTAMARDMHWPYDNNASPDVS